MRGTATTPTCHNRSDVLHKFRVPTSLVPSLLKLWANMDHVFLVALGYFGHNCSEVISILCVYTWDYLCAPNPCPLVSVTLMTFGSCREGRLEGKAYESWLATHVQLFSWSPQHGEWARQPSFPRGGTLGPGVSPVMRAWVGTCSVICTVPENVSALFLRIFNNGPRVGGQVIMCPFAHGNPEVQGD